jgi:transposase
MSTSILYHGFGVKGYEYLKTEYKKGEILFHITKQEHLRCCVKCGSKEVIKKGLILRKVKTVPIGKRKVFLMIHIQRLLCERCCALRQESTEEICIERKRWTRMLERYVLELVKRMTIKDVAEHLHMSWNTVKEIHRIALEREYKRRKIKHLRHPGVDEIAVRKAHKYLTIVVDLETGIVVWVGEGRGVESLAVFLRKLKRIRAPVEAIAMDMWRAYINAVQRYYGKEVIVFDRYHVIAEYNRMLERLRSQQVRQAPAELKNLYKGSRYLLLKSSEKMASDEQASKRLQRLLEVNHELNVAYILKEQLCLLW